MKAIPIKKYHASNKKDGKWIACPIEEAKFIVMRMPTRNKDEDYYPPQEFVLPIILKGSRDLNNAWTWNGDTEKPTVKPNVLFTRPTQTNRCHSWVTDGKVQFLNDSTHNLSGQTVELEDIDPYSEINQVKDK